MIVKIENCGLKMKNILFKYSNLVLLVFFVIIIFSGAAAAAKDLTVTSLNASGNTSPGKDITINYQIENQGSSNVNNGFYTSFYLTPTTSSSSKKYLGHQYTSPLTAHTYRTKKATFKVPSVAYGSYYVVAKVDSTYVVNESNESNNIRYTSIKTKIYPSGWNYQQLSLFSHSESNFTFTYSGDERDDNGYFAKMIKSINSNYPHVLFNINGGDLRSYASQLASFKKDYLVPGYIAHFNRPVLFDIGNHEIQGDPTESIFKKIFGSPTYYSFTENNSYFIMIDNANGELDGKQMNWLKDQLNRSQKYKYRFVFMHIPLYTPKGEKEHSMITNGSGGADALRALFDANNVTMIFASHIHNYYTGKWGKTPYIISGGAGAPPENNQPPNYHYIVINITNNKITYTKIQY